MAKSTNKTTGKTGTTSGTGSDATKAAQSAHQGSGTSSLTALGGAMGLGTGQGAIEALKQDHRRVESLFSQFESASDGHRKEELVAMICTELNIHTRLEEEIFYPACQEEIDDEDLMDEAQVEHDAAKFLIADLLQASCDDPYYDAKVKALKEQIRHHVAEEEKAGEGVFAKAQAHGIDTPQLAAELAERKQELQRRGTRLQPTRAVSFDIDLRDMIGDAGNGGRRREDDLRYRDSRSGWEGAPRRMGMERTGYRDEGDDRERRGRGGWFGRPEGGGGGTRREWDERDERGGRFGRDDWRGASQAGRDRDEDRERYERRQEPGSRGGHGGWYGDPEGHARAARRRWEEQDDDRRGRDWSRRR